MCAAMESNGQRINRMSIEKNRREHHGGVLPLVYTTALVLSLKMQLDAGDLDIHGTCVLCPSMVELLNAAYTELTAKK